MFKFGMGELVIILLIVMVLFGAARLPEIAKSLAKAIKEFKVASKDIKEGIDDAINDDEKKKS